MRHRGQEHGTDLVRQLLELFDLRNVIEEDDDFPAVIDQGRPKLDVITSFSQAFLLKYVVGGPRFLIEKAFVLYELIESGARFIHFLVYGCMDVAARGRNDVSLTIHRSGSVSLAPFGVLV